MHKREYYIQQLEGWSEDRIDELIAGLRHELWTDPVRQVVLPPANQEGLSLWGFGQGFSILVMTRTPDNLRGLP